ncbi:hypothetical protein [Paenibacillus donghaensis]|uniref:Uncharacterized protein n=1 Tax=Paenibacillus donghaensis TaxID=414771 RepID=A0A2Z2KHX6_9BACL|nr:hypothetical protein [Paenibacillus donghaensis]ASA21799.1 hypothetical protein B9T62_14075 [Paenibacillus donghaensis]
MKNFTLRTVDNQNNTLKECELVIGENDILIQTLPKNISTQSAMRMHSDLVNGIESGSPVISIFHGVSLQVLKAE